MTTEPFSILRRLVQKKKKHLALLTLNSETFLRTLITVAKRPIKIRYMYIWLVMSESIYVVCAYLKFLFLTESYNYLQCLSSASPTLHSIITRFDVCV